MKEEVFTTADFATLRDCTRFPNLPSNIVIMWIIITGLRRVYLVVRVIINETSNFRLFEKMSNFSDFQTFDVEKSENEAATFFGPGFVFRLFEMSDICRPQPPCAPREPCRGTNRVG